MEPTTRKERRRRRMEKNMEDEVDKAIENLERKIEGRILQSSEKLFRRGTYTLSRSERSVDSASVKEESEGLNVSSVRSGFVKNSDSEASILTYNVVKDTTETEQKTYNVLKSEGSKENRAIPAPRKSIFSVTSEKVSSDTDRDVAEIDLDEIRIKSDPEKQIGKQVQTITRNNALVSNNSGVTPVPKPRKIKPVSQEENHSERISLEKFNVKQVPESVKDGLEIDNEIKEAEQPIGSPVAKSGELPLLENLEYEYAFKSEKLIKQKLKKTKRLRIVDLVERKGKKKGKSNVLSSVIKLEKTKIPQIQSILKESKEVEGKKDKVEDDEDTTDFQIDSPNYLESVRNGQIYVQDKNGFYVMEIEEVLKNKRGNEKIGGNDRYDHIEGSFLDETFAPLPSTMHDSTVETAILFQKYWSRAMMYFHGILAGFAFGHAAFVTAVILHFNYDPKSFIEIYSFISLKIHFIFYALTTFCIVSCFDRIDVGHINRKHWAKAWRVPSMWLVLCIYVVSFGLTFANQKTESKFDAYRNLAENEPEGKAWKLSVLNEIQVRLLTWYHTIWARDVLLLVGWLIISLTKFSDFLCGHLNNMVKYAEAKPSEEIQQKRLRS